MSSRFDRMARRLVALAAFAVLVACGGGVDSGGTGSFASGPISGFGSVIVNDVHYDDASAAVSDDTGATLDRADLRLGMTVEIEATPETVSAGVTRATARSIRVASELIGPVQAIDAAGATLTVLGETVAVGALTVFDERLKGGLAALAVGDVVQVHGQHDLAARRIAATRIEPAAGATRFKLRAPLDAIDAAADRIVVGGLAITLASLPDPAAALAKLEVGDLVRLFLQPAPAGSVWIATATDTAAPAPPPRREARVNGRITAFASPESFSVDGIAVDASAALFPDGRAGLALGAHVEVEGTTMSSGSLFARLVDLKGDGKGNAEAFELDGAIESIDTQAKTFVLRGVTVSYAETKHFERGRAEDLHAGGQVEVRGALSSDGTRLEATRIRIGG